MSNKYENQSLHYLENAIAFIQAGDAAKAGEFLWGSIAQAFKAVAASKGVLLKSHRDLIDYARSLAKDVGDESIWTTFDRAQSLHSNFYETDLILEDVAIVLEDVKSTLSKLLNIIPKQKFSEEQVVYDG